MKAIIILIIIVVEVILVVTMIVMIIVMMMMRRMIRSSRILMQRVRIYPKGGRNWLRRKVNIGRGSKKRLLLKIRSRLRRVCGLLMKSIFIVLLLLFHNNNNKDIYKLYFNKWQMENYLFQFIVIYCLILMILNKFLN